MTSAAAPGGDGTAKDFAVRLWPAMSDLQKWLLSLAMTIALVAVSYQWLDRPIAFYVHDHVRQFDIFDRLTQFPEFFAPLAGAILFWLSVRILMERPFSRLQATIFLCSVSLAVADAIKNQLKLAFGRTWPETWVRDNPSLIRDGIYGFNPFHGGPGFASFPSGHTAATCAVLSVLWFCYPRYRWLYGFCALAIALALVGADYHFLSDVIAGGFVGWSTGWMGVVMWRGSCWPPIK
jgi:membrane-associated phospholipid phosphatase